MAAASSVAASLAEAGERASLSGTLHAEPPELPCETQVAPEVGQQALSRSAEALDATDVLKRSVPRMPWAALRAPTPDTAAQGLAAPENAPGPRAATAGMEVARARRMT